MKILAALSDDELEAELSEAYLSAERDAESKPVWEWSPDHRARFENAKAEYEKRHPLPPFCRYGMKAKHGYPAKPGDTWVPFLYTPLIG